MIAGMTFNVVYFQIISFFLKQCFKFQESEQRLRSSLKAKLADIISLVPEPIKLANDLHSENMLAALVRDRLVQNLHGINQI